MICYDHDHNIKKQVSTILYHFHLRYPNGFINQQMLAQLYPAPMVQCINLNNRSIYIGKMDKQNFIDMVSAVPRCL